MLSFGLQTKVLGNAFRPLTNVYLKAAGVGNNATVYFPSTAQQITGAGLWIAVENLVLALEADGLITSGVAFYPLLGISGTTSMYNLFNPLNTNAAHRIVWAGGMTHDRLGVTGNGTNGYGNLNINNETHLNGNSTYGFKNRVRNTVIGETVLGVQDYRGGAPRPSMYISPNQNSVDGFRTRNIQDDGVIGFHVDVTNNAAIMTTVINETDATLYRNSTSIQTATEPRLYTDRDIYLFAINFTHGGSPVSNPTSYSTYNLSCAFFYNTDLTLAKITALNTAINNFDTALGR